MTAHDQMASFEKFLAEELADDEVRAAFDDAQTRNQLVDALVRMRRHLGMTQKDVAARMGVKQPTISGFENEGSDPRLSTILRYARAVDSALVWDVRPRLEQVPTDTYRFTGETRHSFVNRNAPSRRASGWQTQVAHRDRWLQAVC
ncbi:Antitoxin HigA [Nostocoides australiense Ben110]|jgi:transcriptional regulator with XRE-family HTH domain|uniref:Antitoxin HigA n=1 Tax=Nostocoides australiense Ben110 TaxID=1193182 RepID=W6JWP4_9MICO|nr:helix-turn-helix transcriptional regulator [Tetrasphaera australiensis]CCH73527.1 Antitoxin HigA [Tetrasphaera australiensis Ben110]